MKNVEKDFSKYPIGTLFLERVFDLSDRHTRTLVYVLTGPGSQGVTVYDSMGVYHKLSFEGLYKLLPKLSRNRITVLG